MRVGGPSHQGNASMYLHVNNATEVFSFLLLGEKKKALPMSYS
jgi:hypothetical protein